MDVSRTGVGHVEPVQREREASLEWWHPSSLMPVLSSRILMAATLVGAACGFSPAAMGAPRSAARRVAMPQPVMEMEVRLAAS